MGIYRYIHIIKELSECPQIHTFYATCYVQYCTVFRVIYCKPHDPHYWNINIYRYMRSDDMSNFFIQTDVCEPSCCCPWLSPASASRSHRNGQGGLHDTQSSASPTVKTYKIIGKIKFALRKKGLNARFQRPNVFLTPLFLLTLKRALRSIWLSGGTIACFNFNRLGHWIAYCRRWGSTKNQKISSFFGLNCFYSKKANLKTFEKCQLRMAYHISSPFWSHLKKTSLKHRWFLSAQVTFT